MTTLEVHVVTPEREVWVGEARIVVARALDGDVGILPGHTPLLAALRVGPMFIEPTEGQRISAAVDGGFVHVTNVGDGQTRVDVLAEHAVLAEELEDEELRRIEEEAERLRSRQQFAEYRGELAKSLTRRQISGYR